MRVHARPPPRSILCRPLQTLITIFKRQKGHPKSRCGQCLCSALLAVTDKINQTLGKMPNMPKFSKLGTQKLLEQQTRGNHQRASCTRVDHCNSMQHAPEISLDVLGMPNTWCPNSPCWLWEWHPTTHVVNRWFVFSRNRFVHHGTVPVFLNMRNQTLAGVAPR